MYFTFYSINTVAWSLVIFCKLWDFLQMKSTFSALEKIIRKSFKYVSTRGKAKMQTTWLQELNDFFHFK